MSEKTDILKNSGAIFFAAPALRALELANAAFQKMKASVLPKSMAEFYLEHNGALLGDATVFPLEDIDRADRRYTVTSIVKVNRDLENFAILRGKTVWGRNAFYLFSADVVGNLYMHDLLTLTVLKKHNDFDRALSDCLLVGKI